MTSIHHHKYARWLRWIVTARRELRGAAKALGLEVEPFDLEAMVRVVCAEAVRLHRLCMEIEAERNHLRAQLAAIEAETTTPREKLADDFKPVAGFIEERCPKCFAHLLAKADRKWCSRPGCEFGLHELEPKTEAATEPTHEELRERARKLGEEDGRSWKPRKSWAEVFAAVGSDYDPPLTQIYGAAYDAATNALPRPIPNCEHVAADGTCGHPNAITAECHEGAPCPAKTEQAHG